MKKISKSVASWQFLLAFIVFLTVLGVVYFYREQVQTLVVVPIIYLLWVVDLAFQMFGQQCIWVLALSITLILSLVFSRRNKKSAKDLNRMVYDRKPATGRIQFWRRQVRISSNAIDDGFRSLELRHLVLQTLAYQENTNIRNIEGQLRSGKIHIPEDVGNFLGITGQTVVTRQSIGLLESIELRIRWIVERFVSPEYSPDPRIEMVAAYLESIMEVDDDARNY